MEPAGMPCSLTPLDSVGPVEVGLDEEVLRGLTQLSFGVSRRRPGSADSLDSPSSLSQPSPPGKLDTHHPGYSFNLPVKHSQPTFSMNSGSGWNGLDMERQALEDESFAHVTEDNSGGGACVASAANASLPREEMGFADFAVFTEQTVHHWCCGLTPSGNPEKMDNMFGQRNSSNSPDECPRNPGQGVLGDPELSHDCLSKANDIDYTVIRHWQEGDAAVAPPSQDQQPPQETAATLFFPSAKPYFKKGEPDQKDLTCRGSRIETSELQEDGGEQGGAEDEPGNDRPVSSISEKRSQSKTGEDLRRSFPSASQENSATFSQPQPGTHGRGDVSDTDCVLESRRDPVHVRTADAAVLILGTLPPSDSFADFCAAPARGDGEDSSWAEFADAKEKGGERAGTRGGASSVPTGAEAKAEQCGVTGESGCQVLLSCRVQQLFLASFLEAEGPSPALEQEVLSLAALLDVQHPPQRKGEEEEEQHSQWIQKGLWWLCQDFHSAVGLRFRWGGSHSSRTLLRCLRVEANDLGLPETTKDSASAACSPGRTAAPEPAPPALQDTPAPSSAPIQETIGSSQMDWNNRGLRSSQDGTCLRRAPHFWGRK